MLQLHVLREETDRVIEGLAKRNFKDSEAVVLKTLDLDKAKRAVLTDIQERESQSNLDSKKIGELMKAGKADEATTLRNQVNQAKQIIKDNQTRLEQIDKELTQLLYLIPNVPASKVPAGKSAEARAILGPVRGSRRPGFSIQWEKLPCHV